MSKVERISNQSEEITPIGFSHFNIPHKERGKILSKISEAINKDVEINRSREVESMKLAEEFIIPRRSL